MLIFLIKRTMWRGIV